MIGFLALKLIAATGGSMTTPYARRLVKAGLITAALLSAALIFVMWMKAREDEAEQRGVTKERVETQAATIEQAVKANEVRNEIELEAGRGAGDALYRSCLQSARTPENCRRFLPVGQTD